MVGAEKNSLQPCRGMESDLNARKTMKPGASPRSRTHTTVGVHVFVAGAHVLDYGSLVGKSRPLTYETKTAVEAVETHSRRR